MPRHLTAALAALTVALTIAACGSDGSRSGSANAAGSSAGQTSAVPAQLQFTAKTIGGQEFSGTSLAGKPAVLWFWAPWCPTCQQEAPILSKVAAANPRVTFVGVAARDQVSAMRSFVDKYHLDGMTQLADTDGAVWSKFGITRQPAWAFVGANGNIDVIKDALTESQLTDRVHGLNGQ